MTAPKLTGLALARALADTAYDCHEASVDWHCGMHAALDEIEAELAALRAAAGAETTTPEGAGRQTANAMRIAGRLGHLLQRDKQL